MWRNYNAMTLATPEAFENDPGLVVSFSTSFLFCKTGFESVVRTELMVYCSGYSTH
jgi:hypothetical protein